MNLEREDSNTKWYRNNGFRRKQRNLGIRSKYGLHLIDITFAVHE